MQPFDVDARLFRMRPVAEAPCGHADPVTTEDLYRLHWLDLVRLGTLLAGSKEIAEDVVQNVFLRLHRSGAAPEKPLAYLRRSVVNGVIDARRRSSVEAPFRWASELTDSLPEPPRLAPHLERLPVRQRDALVLRYYLDLPLKQVAEMLGCSLGTAKAHVHRGLAALRKEVEP